MRPGFDDRPRDLDAEPSRNPPVTISHGYRTSATGVRRRSRLPADSYPSIALPGPFTRTDFQEERPFFIEGSAIVAFGAERTSGGRLFYTRRVGSRVSPTGTPFFCPILNTTVDGNSRVIIEHALPGGVRVPTAYVHLDQIDVQVGQTVSAGQVIGASGDRGCALNPHLHFATYRLTQTNSGGISAIDPYGWEGPTTDPWLLDPDGAASIRLWKPGEAPTLFRFVLTPLAETAGPFVQITQVHFQGVPIGRCARQPGRVRPLQEHGRIAAERRAVGRRLLAVTGVARAESGGLRPQ
jgi:hypothetical protein